MIIIFDGIDGAGKSSVMKEFHKKTNYEYTCFDRGPLSSLAYDYLRGRLSVKRQKRFMNDLNALSKGKAIHVVLFASKQIVKERAKERGETNPFADNTTYEENINAFDEEIRCTCSFLDIIKMDTSKLKPEETASILAEGIRKLERIREDDESCFNIK